jgi:hypothetical protein
LSQYFEAGVSGIPYEINNVEDLADKIRLLLAEPKLREKLGANAYETYYKKYHIFRYCEFLANLITGFLPDQEWKVTDEGFNKTPADDVKQELAGNELQVPEH